MVFRSHLEYAAPMPDFQTVATSVLDTVTPSQDERAVLETTVTTLIDRSQTALDDAPVDGDVKHVGSTARDTWISGDRDIDIFVRFSPTLSRDELTTYGLDIGHQVLPDGREEFAEHPYVTGSLNGFDVDLVPCFAVTDPSDIESAVDRTPFHDAYLQERLTPSLIDEIRVFKQFLKGINVYGSDLRTRGFSGFLTELLIIEYTDTHTTLTTAADWHPPVTLDPEAHGTVSFDDSLVVIDPTDPTRNVAAVVTPANVARLQHHARTTLADPSIARFFPSDPEPLTPAEVTDHLAQRETTPLALCFPTPVVVDDELYPQLQKSLTGIRDALDRRGFEVFRTTTFAADQAVLWFELAVPQRPAVERHDGPPVHVREHADTFYHQYVDDAVYGPFIEGDRYIVERHREFTTAAGFLRSPALFDTRLGPAIEEALRTDTTVLVGEDVAALAEAFGGELARYFQPSP